MEDKMKKLFLALIMLGMALSAFGQNAVTTNTLTAQSSGWYRLPTNHYTAVNWMVRYTVGDSTNVTLTFAYSMTTPPLTTSRIYYSERAADNTAENMTIILDDAAPVWRGWWMEIPQSADYVYVRVEFAAGTTGAVAIEGLLDYAR
jgi:hypothetical protein